MSMDLFGKKQERFEMCDRFIRRLERSDSLLDLFSLHRQIWNSGIRNANIGPCEYGMFRTSDISTMQPSEVFLGNIFGLFTHPLPQWIGTAEEPIIFQQYRDHLISNVKQQQSLIYDNGLCRDRICKGIADASGGQVDAGLIRILDKSMDMNRLQTFIFMIDGQRRISNFVVASGGPKTDLLLLPEKWMQGQGVTSAFRVHEIPVWKDHRFPEFKFEVSRENLAGKLKATFSKENTQQNSQEQSQAKQASRGIKR